MVENLLLGIGLAMDASAVSMTNGLRFPKMKINKILLIALMFGLFQGIMPFIGYLLGSMFEKLLVNLVPWIALILLSFIGGKMFIDGIKKSDDEDEIKTIRFNDILVQAFATSIDALTVGLIFIGQGITSTIVACSTIAAVTFILSFISVFIGKKFGTIFESKAQLVGGIILISIGLKIFIEYLITVL